MGWVLFPIMILGIPFYLVISGVRAPSRARLIIGYSALVTIVLAAGIASSVSADLGLFAFILTIMLAPAALVGGLICAFVVDKWQKFHGVIVGILFPLMLLGSAMSGSEFAPEPLSVEDQYLKYTEELLDTIQAPEQPPILYFVIEEYPDCIAYLKENLSRHSGQYSLKVLVAVDPDRDPVPVGSTAALVLVEFPGGG